MKLFNCNVTYFRKKPTKNWWIFLLNSLIVLMALMLPFMKSRCQTEPVLLNFIYETKLCVFVYVLAFFGRVINTCSLQIHDFEFFEGRRNQTETGSTLLAQRTKNGISQCKLMTYWLLSEGILQQFVFMYFFSNSKKIS